MSMSIEQFVAKSGGNVSREMAIDPIAELSARIEGGSYVPLVSMNALEILLTMEEVGLVLGRRIGTSKTYTLLRQGHAYAGIFSRCFDVLCGNTDGYVITRGRYKSVLGRRVISTFTVDAANITMN